ncbi:hypothetical protein [Erwinia persicina]
MVIITMVAICAVPGGGGGAWSLPGQRNNGAEQRRLPAGSAITTPLRCQCERADDGACRQAIFGLSQPVLHQC